MKCQRMAGNMRYSSIPFRLTEGRLAPLIVFIIIILSLSLSFFSVSLAVATTALTLHSPSYFYSCHGTSHTDHVSILVPPPPFRTDDGGFTNCLEVRIWGCRYEKGLSIMVGFGSRLLMMTRPPVVRIAVVNTTLVGSEASAGAALTVSSSSGTQTTLSLDLVVVNSTLRAHTNQTKTASYAMRLVNVTLMQSTVAVAGSLFEATTGVAMTNAYGCALEGSTIIDSHWRMSGSMFATRSAGSPSSGTSFVWYHDRATAIRNTSMLTVNCSMAAEVTSSGSDSGDAYVWFYDAGAAISDSSTIEAVDCVIASSSTGECSDSIVWGYAQHTTLTASTLRFVNCSITSRGSSIWGRSSTKVWSFSGAAAITGSLIVTTGCVIVSTAAAVYVWFYGDSSYAKGNATITNSTVLIIGSYIVNTASSSITGAQSFTWYICTGTIITSSVFKVTNTSIKSSSSSTKTSLSYVWYGNEATAASTFEFVNCSIVSDSRTSSRILSHSNEAHSAFWFCGRYSSLTNTTHKIFNCSISSFSSGAFGEPHVWYFSSKSINQTALSIHNSSIVSHSNSSDRSHVWCFDFATPQPLVGFSAVVAHCTVRLLCLPSLCPKINVLAFYRPYREIKVITSIFYWYASNYLLEISGSGGGSTPQSLSPGYQCGGASDCGGMLVLVDNRSTPFVQPTPPTGALSSFAVSTTQRGPAASSEAWVEWAEADELCSVMTASGTVRPTAGTDSLSVTHTLFVSSEASGTSTRSSTVTLSISESASTSHSSSSTVPSPSFSSAPTPTPSTSFSISNSLPLDSSSLSLSSSPQPAPSRTYMYFTSLRPLASMSAPPTASNQATASRSLSLSSSLFRSAKMSSCSHHTDSLPLSVTRTQLVLAPIPAGLTKLAEEVAAAASPVVGILAVAGVSGGQLGALGGMARMAKCAADGSDDESRDVSGLPVLVHPLRFSLFSARGESGKTPAGPLLGQYAAAAVSNGAVIPLTVWLVVYWAAPWFVTRCVRVIGCATAPTEDDVRSHLGWPCAMVSPFATFAEGTAVSVVLLWRSEMAHAIVCGAIGCLSIAVVLGWWVRRMHVFIPPSRLRLHTILTKRKAAFCDDNYTEEGKGMLSWYVWCRLGSILDFLGPTHEWVVDDGSLLSAGEVDATVEKAREVDHQEEGLNRTYILEKGTKFGAVEGAESFKRLLRDKRWYYAELVSVLCSLVVGVAEGMPSTGASCSARAAVAMVAVAVQCACGCATFVRYELVLQVLITICTVPMGVLVVCLSSGFVDGVDTEGRILEVMSALNIVANIVGLALVLCQTAGVVLALRKSRSVRARRRATVTHWTEPPATDLEATLTIADEIFGPLTDSSVLLVLPMSPCDAQQNVAPTDEREAERIRGKRLPPPSWVSELLDDVELVVGASV